MHVLKRMNIKTYLLFYVELVAHHNLQQKYTIFQFRNIFNQPFYETKVTIIFLA